MAARTLSFASICWLLKGCSGSSFLPSSAKTRPLQLISVALKGGPEPCEASDDEGMATAT
jgi:hypothetical protein